MEEPTIEDVLWERGFMICADKPEGGQQFEIVPDAKSVAAWVVDNFDYYLANDTMEKVKSLPERGEILQIDFAHNGKAVEVFVIYGK